MAQSSAWHPRLLLPNLVAFGRELDGTTAAHDAIQLLVDYAGSVFAPRECLASWRDGPGAPPLARCHPPDFADADSPLTAAPGDDDIAQRWLLLPLLTEGDGSGSLAIRGAPEGFSEGDLVAAHALVATTSLTLQRLSRQGFSPAHPPWQDALDAIAPALCLIDGGERIRRANRAFANLVPAEPDAVLGRPWRALVPADWIADLERVIRRGAPDRQVELRRGDRVYAASAAPVPGSGEAEVVLLLDDQTERHRLLDQLVQSEKMSAIGQLIAGVAHDLNNPLASVVGFAEFLSERPDVPAALKEPVTVIRDEAERASGIVKNLLSFARKQERQRRPTPIKPLLDSTLALLRNELAGSRVEARLETEPDLPAPMVDPNQIQQVFVNLIHNAAQAIASTGRAGSVTVRARRWTDGVAVDVIDDGPGMADTVAAQVFDPFFTTKPEGQGTGLGLSISQGIVSEHGGRITLETAEGWGSTFTVHLPGGESGLSAVAEGPLAAASGLRILVVDDEPHILHYMRATLESWGHSVAQAADGEEARLRLDRHAFDLVIADLRMPRLGGREFYEDLKRTRPSQAEVVVFATGDTVRGDTLAFLRSVGRPYLHKPFSLTELRALLAGVSKAPGG